MDGVDTLAVQRAVAAAAQRARSGGGATLLELKAYRWGGQTLKDPNRARSEEELQALRRKCPLALLRHDMEAEGLLDAGRFEQIVTHARSRIEQAESKARSFAGLPADPPTPPSSLMSVYAA